MRAWRVLAAATAMCSLMAITALAAGPSGPVSGMKPADPQPAADQLAPGLGVSYFYGLINDVSEIPDAPGKPGAPLTTLSWKMGAGKILTTDRTEGVQARIVGFIKIDKPGDWKFAFNSNDGIRVEIGGKLIYTLPDVHRDTMSEVVDAKFDKAGWYPIKIMYFQKKNTATLEMYWASPDKADLEIVSPDAIAHSKS